jgi:hypothetical protein
MENVSQEIINWIQPTPSIEPLILGKSPITVTYTMVNHGTKWIKIKAIGLEGEDDPRIHISGGTCKNGLNLEPNKFCTVEVTINPIAIGMLQQILYVQHSGIDSPLWIDLATIITAKPIEQGAQKSFLVKDSVEMENNRRLIEQEGHKQFAQVHARERKIPSSAPEQSLEQQNSMMKQHPYFAQNQRYDGIENNINPDPVNNPNAQEKYQEAQEEQDLAKQLRMGKQPEFTNTYKPKLRPFG